MTEEFRRLADDTTGQHGVVTGSQIRDAGITAGQLRRRVQSGILIKSGVHTFRDPLVDRTRLGDLRELVLDCGPRNVRLRPDGRGTAPLRRGLAASAVPRHGGARPQRATSPPLHPHHDRTTVDRPRGGRGTAGDVTDANAARRRRFVSAATLTAALDGALRDGLTTEDGAPPSDRRPPIEGRYGIPKLIAVIEGCEASRGGHSWLERRYLELCDAAGLPRPTVQQVLTKAGGHLVRVDCRFPATNVVVELLGYRWHRTKDQMARDAERVNALLIDGYLPMQFTYDQVTSSTGRRPRPDPRRPRTLRSRLCVTAQVPGDLCGDTNAGWPEWLGRGPRRS